jgi:hypothetical protein
MRLIKHTSSRSRRCALPGLDHSVRETTNHTAESCRFLIADMAPVICVKQLRSTPEIYLDNCGDFGIPKPCAHSSRVAPPREVADPQLPMLSLMKTSVPNTETDVEHIPMAFDTSKRKTSGNAISHSGNPYTSWA